MKKYDFKCFTDIETPETDEIKELLKKSKKTYRLVFGIETVILLITCLLILPLAAEWFISLIVFLLFNLSVVPTTIICYMCSTSYLRKKLKIAKLNDQVRHEERIRIKERKDFEKLLEEANTNYHNLKQTFKEIESTISRNTNTEHIIKKLPPKPPKKN